MLVCAILRSDKEYEDLADEWRELEATSARLPFTNHLWFDAWWRHIGKPGGKQLHIILARDQGKLVGILPLAVKFKPGLRILQGPGLEAFYTSDALSSSQEITDALWQAAHRSAHYDFAMIRDVEAQSFSERTLKTFASPRDAEKAPCLDVQWSSGDAWFESLPKKVKHEHRRHSRRLGEKGAVIHHIEYLSTPPGTILDLMIQHKAEWSARNGKRGLFDQPGVAGFFRQLAEQGVGQGTGDGQLLFAWTECNGANIAFNMGVRQGDVFYDYLITYDPAWMSYSAGNLLMVETIKWAIDQGCRTFNMMVGDGRYKSHLTNNAFDYIEWTFARTLIGRLKEVIYIGARRVRRKLKR